MRSVDSLQCRSKTKVSDHCVSFFPEPEVHSCVCSISDKIMNKFQPWAFSNFLCASFSFEKGAEVRYQFFFKVESAIIGDDIFFGRLELL